MIRFYISYLNQILYSISVAVSSTCNSECLFMCLEIEREDNGNWLVEIRNEQGTATLPFKMRVKGT